MQGFVHSGLSGRYASFLQELELALERGWKTTEIPYFRFGTRVEGFPERPAYRAASRPSFYGGTGFLDTRIDIPLDTVSPASMTLLVTDLFQQDGDLRALVAKIKQKVLPQKLAVLIQGVKADFDGTIYDVGHQSKSYAYRTDGSPKRDRPFYVLAIGRTADLIHLSEQLKAVSRTADTRDSVLLAPELLQTPLDWENADVTGISGASQDLSLVQSGGRSTLAFQKIGDSADSALKVNALLLYEPVPHVPAIRFSKVSKLRVSLVVWARSGLIGRPTAQAISGGAAASSEHFHLALDHGRLALSAKIPRGVLPQQGTYVFALTPELDADQFELPAFCSEWNLDMLAADRFASGAVPFDGAKTQNLSALINSIWAVMIQEYRPNPGSVFFYLRR